MPYMLIAILLAATLALAWFCIAQRRRFRRRLAEAELRRLRTQLNPHFLFNVLNAVAELGYKDPAAADQAITQLSGLLRKSLEESRGPEISLKAEIDFLENYLALQGMLTRGPLDVTLAIDPDVQHARVPAMILQPLVENALIHGARPGSRGPVTITARRQAKMLEIEIRDDGPGLGARPQAGRPGIGLTNTRARLAHLYGPVGRVILENGPSGGAVARITLPFHELP